MSAILQEPRAPDVAMDDVALFALGTMTNSSPAMFERRRRILREARRMIGEGNLESFNVRELCRRADVSSRTVYNAFGSREAVIALAIHDYFEAFHRSMIFVAPPASFEGAMERQIATTLRNMQIPNYLKAVAALYFSPTLDERIRTVLLGIGQRAWAPWLREMRVRRQLERTTDEKRLAIDLSDLQFAKIHHWGTGIIPAEVVLDATLLSVLTMLAGATRGDACIKVRNATAALCGATPAWQAMLADAEARIRQHWAKPAAGQPAQ